MRLPGGIALVGLRKGHASSPRRALGGRPGSGLEIWLGLDRDSRRTALDAGEKRSELKQKILKELVALDVEWYLEWDHRAALDPVEEDTGWCRGRKVGESSTGIDGRLNPQRRHPLLGPAS